jgi:hypothetical protein
LTHISSRARRVLCDGAGATQRGQHLSDRWRERSTPPVGTVFRHGPCSLHGTCLANGTTTDQGRFVFISVDFELSLDPEDVPSAFARWAIDDTIKKLAELGLLSTAFRR